MKQVLNDYLECTIQAAQLCAQYVAEADEDKALALWERYELLQSEQKRLRAGLALALATKAGVSVERVIL